MALTTGSWLFLATLDQAIEVAEIAGLKQYISIEKEEIGCGVESTYYHKRPFCMWQDRQTGGGGCRLVWCNGVVWISRHSGYPQADMTEEVSYLFDLLQCEVPTNKHTYINPHIYGD